MKIRVMDLETAGLHSEDGGVVECGWTDVTFDPVTRRVAINGPYSQLLNPGAPIPFPAMAVHHIRDADVKDKPLWTEWLDKFGLEDGVDAFAAHYARFEQQWFLGQGKPWLCTWKCALRKWPAEPAHGNQVLRYSRELALDPDLAKPPHRAGPDSYVSAHILRALINSTDDPTILVDWSAKPALLINVDFGKHQGTKWKDLPDSYLQWIVGNIGDDEDKTYTAKYWMKVRASENRRMLEQDDPYIPPAPKEPTLL